MEGNAKSPLQWDWENLIMFNAKTTEYPKKLRSSDWVIDAEGSLDFGCFYSSAGVGIGGSSCSDIGHASSKSSKSTSIKSSSAGEIKSSKFVFEAFEDIPEDFDDKKDYSASHLTSSFHTFEVSGGSGEPFLGLKLGKRTYFEDVCAGSNSKTALPVFPMPSKNLKINSTSMNTQRCQVEGCNLDLSSAKSYHRKHRVCESHSKSPKVVVGGQDRRFCQQCSRFHGLSEFDEKKRSCRKRLTDHNARRRKPQPEAIRLNQGRLSSSFSDMRQQMDLVFNRDSTIHARADVSLPWESTCGSAYTITKGYPYKSTKAGAEGELHFASNQLPAPITRVSQDTSRLLPTKVTTAEVLQGIEESGISSSNIETTQDLHRALSLLSTDSWSSTEPKPASTLGHPPIHSSLHHPTPFMSRDSECWQAQYNSTKARVHALPSPSDGSGFQELRALKTPYDAVFYPDELN